MINELIIDIIKSLIPILFLLLGGQWILNRYQIDKKTKVQELELVQSKRRQQYQIVETLYRLFAEFMSIYRELKSINTDTNDKDPRNKLLIRAIRAESEIDALVMRISCEISPDLNNGLEELLGHLRQSVQVWRKNIMANEQLPFSSSTQPDYVRFKETFTGTAAFIIHLIHNSPEPAEKRIKEAKSLLINAFSNKYEFEDYKTDILENWDLS